MSRTFSGAPMSTRLRPRRSSSVFQSATPMALHNEENINPLVVRSKDNAPRNRSFRHEAAHTPARNGKVGNSSTPYLMQSTNCETELSGSHPVSGEGGKDGDQSPPSNGPIQSPLTPVHNLVLHMKKRLEEQLGGHLRKPSVPEKTSPSLTKLRDTPVGLPGKGLKERQHILEKMHSKAKDNVETMNVGGGVCIWPEMQNMRLTRIETVLISISGVILLAVTSTIFWVMHGQLLLNLDSYSSTLRSFSDVHLIDLEAGQEHFERSLLSWHSAYRQLLEELSAEFDASRTTLLYKAYILLYMAGIGVLLYYLTDNILKKSKLTPKRIKIWVSLLVIVGCWTLLSLHMLMKAQNLELAVEVSVHHLSEQLADLVYTDLELSMFHNILMHWRTKCLPPTTLGTLSILGVMQVRDVAYYMQYYSLPIITALLTPVVTLIMSLKEIYSVKAHQ